MREVIQKFADNVCGGFDDADKGVLRAGLEMRQEMRIAGPLGSKAFRAGLLLDRR